MKVGIITEVSYSICNFGNACQAYALNRFISNRYKNEVYTVELKNQCESITSIVLYTIKTIKRKFRKKNENAIVRKLSDKKKKAFVSFFMDCVKLKQYQNISDIEQDSFEAFVVWADVVWHQEHAFINSLKFLDLKQNNFLKLSYAASFGNEWIPRENANKISECLEEFRGVSVREESSVDLLESIGVRNAVHVLDPVFLLGKDEWKEIEKKPQIENFDIENFCLLYLLTPRQYEIDFANKLMAKFNLSGIIVTYTDDAYDGLRLNSNFKLYNDCSPQEWLWLIDKCSYIITDSFHGLSFSTIFAKDFFVMNRKSMMNRLIDFLQHIGSENMLIYEDYEDNEIDKRPNYLFINDYIDKKKKFSYVYLDSIFMSEQ